MSDDKGKKMTKAADAPQPGEMVAEQIIKELDRVHVRTARH